MIFFYFLYSHLTHILFTYLSTHSREGEVVMDNKKINSTDVMQACWDYLSSQSPLIAQAMKRELISQRTHLKLIASENFSSLAVQMAQGNWLTDKYAEGSPGKRFYAGCDEIDYIEKEACRLACLLFQTDHAYVQPHSGSDANLVAYLSILNAKVQSPWLERIGIKNPADISRQDWNIIRQAMQNQRMMALDYYAGGHLTHGYRHNISSHCFDVYTYQADPQTYALSIDAIRAQAKEIKPLILLVGYSAYPRLIDFSVMRDIADEVGAVLMVDMAHFSGLVAGGVFQGVYHPGPYAHIMTSTTHKTLRGPRGGLIVCHRDWGSWVDKGCPMVMGGPLPHVMAAKAVAFQEALQPDFKDYAHRIVDNARYLAECCMKQGMHVVSGGTDNHMLLINVSESFGLTGKQAESALRACGMTVNRNALVGDVHGPWYTSGLRLGTPALTTLGMGKAEMEKISKWIYRALSQTQPIGRADYQIPSSICEHLHDEIKELLTQFPLYPGLF